MCATRTRKITPISWGVLQDEKKDEVKVSKTILTRYAGTYRAGPLGNLRVMVDGDQLAVALPGGGGRHAAIAKSDEDFFLAALGASLKFMKDAQGDVTHLRITMVEGDVSAPRLPDTDGGTK